MSNFTAAPLVVEDAGAEEVPEAAAVAVPDGELMLEDVPLEVLLDSVAAATTPSCAVLLFGEVAVLTEPAASL